MTDAAEKLETLIRRVARDLMPFEREYQFLSKARAPEGVKARLFRFDLAWPVERVAVEVDGGVWAGGRHTRGSGFVKDMEKLNLAVLLGWRVLRYTPQDLKQRPAQVVEEIRQALSLEAAQ